MSPKIFLLHLLLVLVTFTSTMAQRLAAVGDSITHGFGAAPWTGFIAADLPGWEILNYGYVGATVSRSGDIPYNTRAEYFGALDSGANIVVIMLGTNDGKAQNWTDSGTFQNDYRALIDEFANRGTDQIFIVTPIPVLGAGDYGIASDIVNNLVAPAIRGLAGYRGAQLIDLHSQFPTDGSLYREAIHPTDNGGDRIASIIQSAVAPAGTSTPQPQTSVPRLVGEAEDLGGGWRRIVGLGDYYAGSSPWLYHSDLGWVWNSSDNPDSLWLWSPSVGFIWTKRGSYPSFYRLDTGTWYLFDRSASGDFVYDFGGGGWVASPFSL